MSAAGIQLEQARAAARAFCAAFDFPAEQRRLLEDPPVLGPVPVEREGVRRDAYRWLGGGRGGPYVQVEIAADGGVVVYGGRGDDELGPWRP